MNLGAWYREAFGDHYLQVYARRQAEAARRETAFAREMLHLERGERVLDFCCGPGFHLEELLRAGLQAAGFDLSPELIALARRRGPAVRGDMRAVPYAGGFGAVLSFFTTIGYFDDAGNELVFREINRLLAPGGRFLVDYLNPAEVREGLVPASERTVAGTRIIEKRWIEDQRVWKEVRLRPPDRGPEKIYTESVRLYEGEELAAMMEASGLALRWTRGDFTGAPFAAASPRMILGGRKERDAPGRPWKGEEPMFRQLPAGHDRNFAYLLADGGEAALVDPARPDVALAAVAEAGLELKYILNTHGHYDHAGGNQEVKEGTGARVAAHAEAGIPKDIALEGGERLPLGSTEIEVLATPGHTRDSICLLWQGRLMTGDTLFVGKVGGTATAAEARAEYESLHRVIGALPGETEVWPGHDVGVAPSSTVAREKETNPFYLQPDFEAFLELKNNWAEYKKKHGID